MRFIVTMALKRYYGVTMGTGTTKNLTCVIMSRPRQVYETGKMAKH